MSSPERIYALLVEANPIPDPQSVPPAIPSLADERRSIMPTRQPTEAKQVTTKPRYSRALAAFAGTILVIGAVVVVAWVLAAGDGPVAAGDARIEVTFTGDGTSYLGDREIIEGTVEVTFTNASEDEVALALLRYDTGSVELADELKFIAEGESVPPGDHDPAGDFEFVEGYRPGTFPVKVVLQPGTYLVDISHGNETHVVSRAAVIEVVAAD